MIFKTQYTSEENFVISLREHECHSNLLDASCLMYLFVKWNITTCMFEKIINFHIDFYHNFVRRYIKLSSVQEFLQLY